MRSILPSVRIAGVASVAMALAAILLGAQSTSSALGDASAVGDPIDAVLNGDFGRIDQPGLAARFHAIELTTSSMEPNLVIGELLLTDRAAYSSEPIARGDIIEYRMTASQAASCGVSVSATRVKRVIGLPGDHVQVPAGRPEVIINGTPFVVDNAPPNPRPPRIGGSLPVDTFDVPEGKLFILGDNRPNSCDSLQWIDDPFLPIGKVRGRVSAIYFPRARVARVLTAGTIQPVDVAASPLRPRFDYLIILGRAAKRIGQASEALLDCARKRECPELRELRSIERAFGGPVTDRAQFLRRKRLELAGAIKTQLRYLRTPTRRVQHDCAGPTARRLAAALARDRRLARSQPATAGSSRRIAVETGRQLVRAVIRTGACWS